MAKYRIGQLSKLLGIPASTIRYYEQCGVLTTKHDQNGYRYYDEVDVHNIMHYQYYRAFDYQPNEAAANLYDYTMEQIIESGSINLAQLEQELWFNQRRVKIQQERLEFLQQAKIRLNRIERVVRPALYVLAYRVRSEDQLTSLLEESAREQQIRQWMRYMPLVSLTPLIQAQDFLYRCRKEYSALWIDAGDAKRLGIENGEFSHYLEPTPCLRFTFYRQKGYMHAFVDYAQKVYEFLDTHGLTVSGPVTFSHYLAFHKHTTHEFYGEMLIPYTKL